MINRSLFLKSIFLFFLLLSNSYSDGLFFSEKNSFLKVDEAFTISVEEKKEKNFLINFNIKDGYYLYKEKIKIYINSEEIKVKTYPKTKIRYDEFFGESEIYDEKFSLNVKSNQINNSIEVIFQGCANKGLCYPPKKKSFIFGEHKQDDYLKKGKTSESEIIYDKLLTNNIVANIILFLGFGLLLSFTPCVLPMVPILSGIIIKSNNDSSKKSFFLSFNYVLGLCLLYFLVGIFVGYSTNIYNIQSIFQEPIYLVFFIFILLALSLSMFGFYEIKFPNSFQKLVSDLSNKVNIGGYRGSFLMGFLSALIVGPCIAPPLAGIFIYITSENPGPLWTGILFLSLAIGMSLPLLAYGTFIGNMIPKAGKWMKYINYIIGILLLITTVFFVDRLIPVINLDNKKSELVFKRINNIKELNSYLNNKKNKISFLDVYADWCIECKLMEQKTFRDADVEKIMKNFLLFKIDVTNNSEDDLELLEYLNILGPPAYKFFSSDGIELKGFSIQGYMNAEKFKKHLKEIKNID